MRNGATAQRADIAIVLLLSLTAVLFWKLRIIDPAQQAEFVPNITNVDFFTHTLPVAVGAVRSIFDGELPLWNPYQAGGHPMLATIPAGVLYPLNFPFLLLPAHLAIEAVVVLHLILAGAFTFAYARSLSLALPAAAGAAAAFMLSGYLSSCAVWFTPALAACVWLPLALLAIERILERPRAMWVLVLATAIAMPILAGWLQIWLYSIYAIGITVAFQLAGSLARGDVRRVAICLSLLAAGAALGLALAAVQLLPSFELQALSPRRTGSLSSSQRNFFESMTVADLVAYATRPTAGHPRWGYLGMAALVLVPLSPLCRGVRLRVAALWCVLLLAIGVALTVHTPFYALFLKLPTSDWFRSPERILFLHAFAGAILAGIGIQAVAQARGERGRRALALCVAVGAAGAVTFAVPLTLAAFAYLWISVVAVAGALLLPDGRPRAAAAVGLAVLLAGDLFFATRNVIQHPVHQPELRQRERQVFDYVRSRQGLDRTFIASANPFNFFMMAKHGTLERIYSITDYEPLSLERRSEFLRLIDRTRRDAGDATPFAGQLDIDLSDRAFAFLDLISVRFAIVARGDRPLRRALGHRRAGWRNAFVPSVGSYVVYENRKPLPRAYVAYDIVAVVSGDAALAAVSAPDFAPRRSVVIEGGVSGSAGGRIPITPAQIVEYEPDRVLVEADVRDEGYLVLTDTYYPGWQARVDGAMAPIHPANYLFRGVRMTPGRHRVEFTFAPTTVRIGGGLTLAALVVMAACVAQIVLRRAGRRPGPAAATAILLAGVLFSSGCAPDPPTNVVVFVLDTQRADHLGTYGYRRDVSPDIDALAREGVVFENASSTAPRTWQSFTSILTGLNPPRHGVRFIFSPPLAGGVPTLGSVLARAGYQTAAFDGMTFLRDMTGAGAFQQYVDPRSLPGGDMLGDDPLTDAFVSWLDRARPPFLAFLRLTAPHWTYTCAPVFHDGVASHDSIDHGFNAGSHGLGIRDGELGLSDTAAYRRRFYEYDPSDAEREHMILHYDECVRSTDAAVGRGLDRLHALGLMESTLVVVTADHGESFGEHGYFQHGPQVDGPVVDVPLIFRFPERRAAGRRGVRVGQLVRTVDVLPTILDVLGIEAPPDLDGTSLLPAIDRGADLGLAAYAEGGRAFVGVDPEIYLPGVAGKWRMLREGNWKLVFIPDGRGGIARLYDLASDPGEMRDVSTEHPEVSARLRAALEDVMRTDPGRAEGAPELTDEERDRLRALGYL